MLDVGEQAPFFMGNSTKGVVSTEEYKGKNAIVLIFYPKIGSPICTQQLNAVEEALPQYESAEAKVFAINPADLADHQAFADEHHYSFPLVTDHEGLIQELFGVDKGLLRLFVEQKRVVYVIGRNGQIVYARKGNRSTDEILEAVGSDARTSLKA
ncbi:peroxiredoxin family protein [Paenibacillus eucommiae]|uniref:thioredoxin-dependent peroxiredoxin n=1 Tax=Paenibacillus eucommiae TaxID=1355755 RepID=A0ABS4IXF2_9BACL|nr:redoxin domain-containing protein [Paenibacillus eucommiae]MBP1991681.1 peroxiredoxin Q/BCP [Paenibacillus eucommiae]